MSITYTNNKVMPKCENKQLIQSSFLSNKKSEKRLWDERYIHLNFFHLKLLNMKSMV